MMNYILGDYLKYKRTFLKKIIYIIPISLIILSYLLVPPYFTIDSYNWWYTIIMPITYALIPALMNRYEDKKIKYRAVYPLSIDLRKIWISKIIVASCLILMASLVHLIAVLIVQFIFGDQIFLSYSFSTLLVSSILLVVSSIWQIPFCLLLAKKFGFSISLMINGLLGVALGIVFSAGNYWLLSPYSWSIRTMVPMLKIMPNGLPADGGNMMLNTSIFPPCIFSILLFLLLSYLSSIWFAKQEVR